MWGENRKDGIWVAGGRQLFRSQWSSLESGSQLGTAAFKRRIFLWKATESFPSVKTESKPKRLWRVLSSTSTLSSERLYLYFRRYCCLCCQPWQEPLQKHQLPNPGVLFSSPPPLTEMFHYCVDSAAFSHFVILDHTHTHTNDSVLKAEDQVLIQVWNVALRMTVRHGHRRPGLLSTFLCRVQQMLKTLNFWARFASYFLAVFVS